MTLALPRTDSCPVSIGRQAGIAPQGRRRCHCPVAHTSHWPGPAGSVRGPAGPGAVQATIRGCGAGRSRPAKARHVASLMGSDPGQSEIRAARGPFMLPRGRQRQITMAVRQTGNARRPSRFWARQAQKSHSWRMACQAAWLARTPSTMARNSSSFRMSRFSMPRAFTCISTSPASASESSPSRSSSIL